MPLVTSATDPIPHATVTPDFPPADAPGETSGCPRPSAQKGGGKRLGVWGIVCRSRYSRLGEFTAEGKVRHSTPSPAACSMPLVTSATDPIPHATVTPDFPPP